MDWAVMPNCAPCYESKSTKKEIHMSKKFSKQNKTLLFLEPINKDMSVDTIFNNLVRILEEKGIKINTNEAPKKGVGK
jgi:hypothetical protein